MDRPGSLARLALTGLAINTALASVKLVAGLVGHSYALVADAVESMVDIAGSFVIWAGLRYAERPPDARHPYGLGRAEPLAALAVAGMVAGAGVGIAAKSIDEILTPHHAPAWWTLPVLLLVVVVKWTLARVVERAARRAGSSGAAADAGHHRSDALTSLAAFIGISLALLGGPGWEPADDWAALIASGIILWNAWGLAKAPLNELLDRQPEDLSARALELARGVDGVANVQRAWARKSGTRYFVEMHVRVDPLMTVFDSHRLAHAVKDRIRAAIPAVADVLIHIEPAGPMPDSSEPTTGS